MHGQYIRYTFIFLSVFIKITEIIDEDNKFNGEDMLYTLTKRDRVYETLMTVTPNFDHKRQGGYPMIKPILYRGMDHRMHYVNEILQKRDSMTDSALASYYLLTADNRLWMRVQHCCQGAHIPFKDIVVGDVSPEAYTLFVVARDIYCDTQQIHIGDLIDDTIISQKMFYLIMNAFAIRRNGLEALALLSMKENKTKEGV